MFDDFKDSFDIVRRRVCGLLFEHHRYGAFVYTVLGSVVVFAFRPVQGTFVLHKVNSALTTAITNSKKLYRPDGSDTIYPRRWPFRHFPVIRLHRRRRQMMIGSLRLLVHVL